MRTAAREKLFESVDRYYYDLHGFVDPHKLQKRFGIKSIKIARALEITQPALQKSPHSDNIQLRLRKIVYILTLLREMLHSDRDIDIWLRAPNPDYDGLSPIEVITQGKMDSLINYLVDIKKGALT